MPTQLIKLILDLGKFNAVFKNM